MAVEATVYSNSVEPSGVNVETGTGYLHLNIYLFTGMIDKFYRNCAAEYDKDLQHVTQGAPRVIAEGSLSSPFHHITLTGH